MTDLTTRLLAEIERRESEHRSTLPMRDIVDRRRDKEPLAYLGALRKVVDLHRLYEPPEYRGVPCCARCSADGSRPAMDRAGFGLNWPCPTLAAVAGALGVEG